MVERKEKKTKLTKDQTRVWIKWNWEMPCMTKYWLVVAHKIVCSL